MPSATDGRALPARRGSTHAAHRAGNGRVNRSKNSSVRARVLSIAVLVAALVSLLLAVPGLQAVASEIRQLSGRWLVLAGALEVASCVSFVVVFRHFFSDVPARPARNLAWAEMGSGALLPGGGVGSLAVGGWLLHLAGMPTARIVRNSSGLFFLTSAVNVAALLGAGVLLATGLSAGRHDVLLAGLPILAGSLALAAALGATAMRRRGSSRLSRSSWAAQLFEGLDGALHALRHPNWRLAGAIGYLGFDIAVLWATLNGVGYSPPVAVLVLGYIIGYLANVIPVPGAVGVLEGGLAGTLVLYGAPVTEAAAAVLVYHAIAFWIPSIGGLLGYRRLRLQLSGVAVTAAAGAPATSAPLSKATADAAVPRGFPAATVHRHPLPAPGERMQRPETPQPVAPSPTPQASPRVRPSRPRRAMRSRHVEAHAVAWLRSLRQTEGGRSSGATRPADSRTHARPPTDPSLSALGAQAQPR
jgi:uncharacterized membrane protein YbhN (UPF0104 family)